MKKKITSIRLHLILFIFILNLTFLFSQTPKWQWVKGGGSWASTNSGLMESCRWIGSDAHGNIYGMSSIYSDSIQIDASPYSNGFGNDDFAVFSYRCDGSLRWTKFFGGHNDDSPFGMFTDYYGNSFVAGQVIPSLYFDNHYGDSIIPYNTSGIPDVFVAKLDSNGHTAWLKLGPKATSFSEMYSYLSVREDIQGNVCVLAKFNSALGWGTFNIPDKGYYVLKFDKNNGNLLGFTKLDYTDISWHSSSGISFVIDNDNNYYLSDGLGYPDSLLIGNNLIVNDNSSTNITLLTKFLPTGNLSWYKEVVGNAFTGQYKSIYGSPLIIGAYIYINGMAQNNVNFFGTIISNPYLQNSSEETPFIARFRKDNGNFVSLKHIYNSVLTNFDALTLSPNGIIVSGATGTGSTNHEVLMYNLTDTLKPITTIYAVYPFLLGIDTALTNFNWGVATRSNIPYPRIEALTVDLAGNIYAGGMQSDSIYNSFGVGIKSQGGPSDFFIAKIALQNNCSCIKSQPYPQLQSVNNKTITVKGNATGLVDSIYWSWGDGTISLYITQNTNITHTYTNGGNYTVCLHTSNYCGTIDSCFTISGVGISEQELKYLNTYPNPVSNCLTIENPYQCSMQLNIYSISGKLLYSNKYHNYINVVDMNNYEDGIYFMEIILADGRKAMRKVVKQ